MTVNCKICGKQFDSFRGLNGHMNAHLPSHRKRAESELCDNCSGAGATIAGCTCGYMDYLKNAEGDEELDDEDYWEPYLEALEIYWWHCVSYVDYASETYSGIVECICG